MGWGVECLQANMIGRGIALKVFAHLLDGGSFAVAHVQPIGSIKHQQRKDKDGEIPLAA